MSDEEKIVERFYDAFARKDWAGMHACYHKDIEFTDPVFRTLKGLEAKAMWHMLVESGRELTITHTKARTEGGVVKCGWEATYLFSLTGRRVHNVIEGTFWFRDGLIVRHEDRFDFWRWTRMALGASGWLLGWSGVVQGKVRATAGRNLRRFVEGHPEYQTKRA